MRIGEATTGLGEEMSDVGMALQRAQDKTDQMQARAAAVNELVETGAIDDLTAPAGDDLDRQIASLTAGSQVDAELAKMKAELGSVRRLRASSRQVPRPPRRRETAAAPSDGEGGGSMIVRILERGPVPADDGLHGRLNELDNARRRRGGDGRRERSSAPRWMRCSTSSAAGTPVADDELVTSDHVLPHAEITLVRPATRSPARAPSPADPNRCQTPGLRLYRLRSWCPGNVCRWRAREALAGEAAVPADPEPVSGAGGGFSKPDSGTPVVEMEQFGCQAPASRLYSSRSRRALTAPEICKDRTRARRRARLRGARIIWPYGERPPACSRRGRRSRLRVVHRQLVARRDVATGAAVRARCGRRLRSDVRADADAVRKWSPARAGGGRGACGVHAAGREHAG